LSIRVDFLWSRAYSTRPNRAAYVIEDGKILQTGDAKEFYSPSRLEDLYLEFAQLDGSSEACLGFASKYGLLREEARLTRPPTETLADWRSEIRRMASNIRRLPQVVRVVNSVGTYVRVAKIDVFLMPGEGADASPVMVMQPGSLLDAMKLEMAQFISGGGRLIPCRNCATMFQAGRAGGKRAGAQFHNDECRIAFNNAKRRGK
jgi:hypothetical protein